MKYKRIITCDHNSEDTLRACVTVLERLPKGYSCLVVPDDGHPVALIPDGIIPDIDTGELPDKLLLPDEALFVMALSQLGHSRTFMRELIETTIEGVKRDISEDGPKH